ncbi:hypothetical protein DCCM_2628 [Desulfocucumis palustris]|uniref:Gamma-glutamylcyclotransferase AIG2-like domain-containing protein n=1 Tax=Desulfocucumis palustris TaxID=1898651 RepID=A0A2L2XH28_9FIRM|nr:gamma-glutamylcyclotransferase family protein [Desulfocucumis palustris]GBF33526.1 hypothetical protein DCCM_2628 [Desulfocucumis palustris]
MYLNNLFVFGTLLPGLENHKKFIEKYKPAVYTARARGVMYYLPSDDYPVVLEGDGEIKGIMFDTPEMSVILPEIDEIEKFTGVESQSHLIREIKEVELLESGKKVKAHMYLWPPSKADWLKKNGVLIPDGDWARFLRENGKL